MQDVDFLRFVLPEDGWYCAATLTGKGHMTHQFFQDLDELYAYAKQQSDKGFDAYYGCAAFLDSSSRKSVNTDSLKAFYLDIDCGEGKDFPSPREGLTAVVQTCKDHGLPKPTIVSSGNGLHIYWVLTEAISYPEWRQVARKLKEVTPYADPAVTADAARILRIPGTINSKGQKPVKVLHVAPATTLARFKAALTGDAPQAEAPPKKATRAKDIGTRLLEAMASDTDLPPAKADLILESCKNLRWAYENQEKVSEPYWYATLGVAAFCENPEETAISWSKNYENYDEEETRSKVTQWKDKAAGPTTCAKLRDLNEGGCEGCPFAEKITSPARLGLRSTQVEVDESAPDEIAAKVPVPKGFKRTTRGFVVIDENKVEVLVCDFDIYPVSYGYDEILGYEVCRFRWNRLHVGWTDITLRQALLAPSQTTKEFGTAIADKGIILNSMKQVGLFQTMLRGYVHELRKMQTLTNLFSTMGWKNDHTQFVLGEDVYRRTESGQVAVTEVKFAGANGSVAESLYSKRGTPEQFAKFTVALEKANLPLHNWMIMVGMSSIMYDFSGINGVVINLYGPTGAGKTLAQYCQQAVWGNPTVLHYGANFTGNALYQKIALHNHLPFTIDEGTLIPTKDLGALIYSVSQGREKARLGRTAEAKEVRTWALPLTTSSNVAFGSLLTSGGHTVGAQLARLIDVKMDAHPLLADSSATGARMYEFVTGCYGHIGPKLVEYILSLGTDAVVQMFKEHKEKFKKEYGSPFSGNERFWEQAIVSADFCGMIAAEQGWILCDYRKATQAALYAVGVFRENLEEAKTDCFDIVGEYINAHVSETLVVNHVLSTGKATPDFTTEPRGSVHIRFDIYRPTPEAAASYGTVLFDRKHFKTWVAVSNNDYRGVIAELIAEKVVTNSRGTKVYFGKNTRLKLPQMYAISLTLKHPRLRGMLRSADDRSTDAALAALQKT